MDSHDASSTDPSAPSNHQGLEISHLAIASLMIGLLSYVHLFGVEKAILALVLGLIALRQISLKKKTGKGFAYFGIIFGVVYIVIIIGFYVACPKILLP